MITNDTVHSFLAGNRIAVVGASASSGSFGRAICTALADHGYEPIPVHPSVDTLDGRPVYPRLQEIPAPVDGAIVMVPGDAAAAVVDDAAAAGIHKVWLFKGIGGPGAVSDESLAACKAHGMETVVGACPLMFLEPVSMVHRIHRSARRLRGGVERVA